MFSTQPQAGEAGSAENPLTPVNVDAEGNIVEASDTSSEGTMEATTVDSPPTNVTAGIAPNPINIPIFPTLPNPEGKDDTENPELVSLRNDLSLLLQRVTQLEVAAHTHG